MHRRGAAGFAALTLILGWVVMGSSVSALEGPSPAAVPPTERSASAETAEPEWLLEEETGKRYRLHEIRKSLAPFEKLEGDRVRFVGGAEFAVVEEDDERFLVKVYETPNRRRPPRAEEAQGEEVAASYLVTTSVTDRLHLRPFDEGLPGHGQWRNGFDVADLDGDGHLDIVFGPARKGNPRPNAFLGDGQGRWRTLPFDRFPALPYDYGDVATADFNGDGRTDVALAMHLLGAVVLIQDGDGRFRSWSAGIELGRGSGDRGGPAFSSRALTVGDWNEDGRPDLVLMGEGPRSPGPKAAEGSTDRPTSVRGVRVYLNRGDGTWESASLAKSGPQDRNFADSIALGDLDRDGDVDVVTGTRQLGNRRLAGYRDLDGQVRFDEIELLRKRGIVLAVAVDDVDRDTWPDIVVAYQSNEGTWRSGLDILWGGEEGWSRQGLVARETRQGLSALAIGDIDGDDHTDVVAVDQSSELFVFLGDGDRAFAREAISPGEVPEPSAGCAGFGIRLRDLDGDGRDEIIAAFAGEKAGFADLAGFSTPGCPGGGSLRVWRAELGSDSSDQITRRR